MLLMRGRYERPPRRNPGGLFLMCQAPGLAIHLRFY
jgi:hypothetical protein